jgi:hypothetical protein
MFQLKSSDMNGQRCGCGCLIGHRHRPGHPVVRLSFPCGTWCTIFLLLCFLVPHLMISSDHVIIQPLLELIEQGEPYPADA